jgi:hypothetical protein
LAEDINMTKKNIETIWDHSKGINIFLFFFFIRQNSFISRTLWPAQQFPFKHFCSVCELSNYKFLSPLDIPLHHPKDNNIEIYIERSKNIFLCPNGG